MFSNEFVISLSFLGTSHALEGASAIFSLDGTYSIHTFMPAEAASAQNVAHIWFARSESPFPDTRAAKAARLSTNRMTGVFRVYFRTRHRPRRAANSSHS